MLKASKQYVSRRKKFVKKPFDFDVTSLQTVLHRKKSGSEKKLYFQRNDFVAVRNENGVIFDHKQLLCYVTQNKAFLKLLH